MSADNPFAPMGGYGQAGKPAPQRPNPMGRYSAMAAYGDMARPQQGQPLRPTPNALSAYGGPARQGPMGYGYGMAPQRGGFAGHGEPDRDEWGGPSDMDADNGMGGYGRPRARRPMGGNFAGVSPSNPYSNGGGY